MRRFPTVRYKRYRMTAMTPLPIDIEFDATLTTDNNSGWACVSMSGSAERFGTGKAIKVVGTVDGHPLQATMLPTGGGTHMLPIKAAVRKTIGKGVGDRIMIHLTQRLT